MARPPKWKNLAEFKKSSDGFFKWCEENNYIPDIEALAVYMDTTRKTILDYEGKDGFSYTIKKIKDRIFFNKKQLAFRNKINATVFIFDAKNNHDYKDRQDVGFENVPPLFPDTAKKEK